MYQGMIQDITWNNPSQIVKVDNENTKILPWSEIQKIFERQIGYMLTPSDESRAEGCLLYTSYSPSPRGFCPSVYRYPDRWP